MGVIAEWDMVPRSGKRVFVASLLVLCALTTPAAEPSGDPFPRYDSLEGHVGFWTRVFGEWRLDQIAVHDLDHPAVVYEVVPLAGPTEFPYTDAQRDYIDGVREGWEERLERLERKVVSGEALTDDDKALVLKITTNAGTDAVRGAHERVRTQRGLRERFKRGLEISGRYMDRFRRIFREAGLPEDLAYLPHVESSFQYEARSTAGAVGVWQFTRGTGRIYMVVNSTVDERLDPVAATYGAAEYLRDAHDRLGHWPLALTSYNHGVHGMSRAKREFGTDFERIVREYRSRTFGFASRNFYCEFLAARDIARAPDKHFPEGLTLEARRNVEEVVLERRSSPGNLARRYRVPVDELAALNPGWSDKAVRRGHAVPAGVRVWLPPGTLARAERIEAHGVEHVVRKGDSLSTIAARYGTTVDELRRLNGISPGRTLIRAGQTLVVQSGEPPAEETATHVVRRGDNLSTIAERYGMTVEDLRDLNGMSSRQSVIHPGQSLTVYGDGSTADDVVIHVVRRGDNLSTIAKRYGTTVSEIRRLNGMSSRQSVIRIGQELRVRGAAGDPVVHVVRRGDTLTEIAAVYGVPLTELLSANRLGRRSTIYPGQRIHIPR